MPGAQPDELVNAFFVDSFQRDDYLTRWRASDFALRSWLVNGLFFQAHVEGRRGIREVPWSDFDWEPASCQARLEAEPLEALHEACETVSSKRRCRRARITASNGA